MTTGRFVVLEGIDGAGTSTQAARLVEALQNSGKIVVATREPTDGGIGSLIRAILRRDSEASPRTLPWLFAADRQDHLVQTVEPALVGGRWVVSDRYYHSSLAYQSLELPLAQVAALNASFRAPDLTVVLDVPVDVALARIEARGAQREIFEERGRLERISARYEEVLALLVDRGEAIVRVDGTQPVGAVFDEVLGHVRALG